MKTDQHNRAAGGSEPIRRAQAHGRRNLAGRHSLWIGLVAAFLATPLPAEVALTSPGLKPSHMDDQGRLVEDWGTVAVGVTGPGLPEGSACKLESIKLDGLVPAARALTPYGPVMLSLTAFRAPAWPAGLDVLTVRLEETGGEERTLRLSVGLPETARLGSRTANVGGRLVLGLPGGTRMSQATRDWGWTDDAVAMPGWARPAVDCDPAFRNIRAGMGGVPIRYQFKVEPGARVQVVLGLCESHWDQAGQRPVVCEVEGAPPREADPLALWGQHRPGTLLFAASDANGDGKLEVAVLPKPGAPDQNPLLNAIWLFPAEANPNLDQVLAGKLNSTALRYIDVGGANDQSLYAGGQVEYALKLPARGSQELMFLVACPEASVPPPEQTAWTLEKLRHAAAAVWRDWR